MSLHPLPVGPVPEETVRVARAAFPKGTVYMHMRDALGDIYNDVKEETKFMRKAMENDLRVGDR